MISFTIVFRTNATFSFLLFLQTFYDTVLPAELISPMDQVHFTAVIGEEFGILKCRAPAADDSYVSSSEEHTVTCSTIGDSGPCQALLIRYSEMAVCHTGCQNDTSAWILFTGSLNDLDRTLVSNPRHLFHYCLGSQFHRLNPAGS